MNENIIKQTKQRTPLHLAVENKNVKIIQLLLSDKKIDINTKDENGKIPIEYTENKEIIEMFNHQ